MSTAELDSDSESCTTSNHGENFSLSDFSRPRRRRCWDESSHSLITTVMRAPKGMLYMRAKLSPL